MATQYINALNQVDAVCYNSLQYSSYEFVSLCICKKKDEINYDNIPTSLAYMLPIPTLLLYFWHCYIFAPFIILAYLILMVDIGPLA